jgi:deoxyribodipyrimidine photo-lyase
MQSPVIHWFRRDLRLSDNTALVMAAADGQPVLPVFIFDETIIMGRFASAPRLGFLLKALRALDADLRQLGSALLVRRGEPGQVLHELIAATGSSAVCANADYTPYARQRDAAIMQGLGVPFRLFDDAALIPPGDLLKGDGFPFVVFSPFKKVWLKLPKASLLHAPPPDAFLKPGDAPALEGWGAVPRLGELGFTPTIDLPEASPAEALRRLEEFISGRAFAYATGRNMLAAAGADDTRPESSFLSPYLRFGMLSPRQAYHAARDAYPAADTPAARDSLETWVSELVWRDFYMHILYHFPHVLKSSFRPEYDRVEWRQAPGELDRWKAGLTGYPVVDAAMRQLQAMGWMPNRARMIVASFLTKDLLIDWRAGERHFMHWLIDGDPAANNGGWQWSAGTGTDAQPYFRIFNPVSQGETFDLDGRYVKRWVPELADLPVKFIHQPWNAPAPPPGYPPPMVNHSAARDRTLAAFKAVKG